MSNKKKKDDISDENLNMIFRKKDKVLFEWHEGRIRIYKDQKHWTQNLMRKLGAKIPQRTYMSLDEYGTLVFSMIDGKTTVKEIGEALSAQHEEASQQLYERLFLYLNHLESVERWIEIVEKGE